MQIRSSIPKHSNALNSKDICALDDIVPWPTDDQAIACLHGGDQDANLIWRPNPDFPYIYVSFSYNQLAQAYLLDFYPQGMALKWQQIAEAELLRNYNIFIRSKIIEPTKLPIKFLSSKASAKEIKKKNVVFVVAHDPAVFSNDMEVALTIGFDSPASRQQHAHFMVVSLPPYNLTEFTANNIFQRIFLHEIVTHAILEGKHPKPYNPFPEDKKPYCQFDCSETVMAYNSDCSMPKDHPDYYPAKLGRYDFLAAEAFKESWQTRNQAELALRNNNKKIDAEHSKDIVDRHKKSVQDTKYTQHKLDFSRVEVGSEIGKASTHISFMHSTYQFLFNRLNQAFDHCIDSLQRGAIDVVQSCPSYFCQDDVTQETYWLKTNKIEQYPRLSAAKHSLMYQPTATNITTKSVNHSVAKRIC